MPPPLIYPPRALRCQWHRGYDWQYLVVCRGVGFIGVCSTGCQVLAKLQVRAWCPWGGGILPVWMLGIPPTPQQVAGPARGRGCMHACLPALYFGTLEEDWSGPCGRAASSSLEMSSLSLSLLRVGLQLFLQGVPKTRVCEGAWQPQVGCNCACHLQLFRYWRRGAGVCILLPPGNYFRSVGVVFPPSLYRLYGQVSCQCSPRGLNGVGAVNRG
jgi:hypothetical protein